MKQNHQVTPFCRRILGENMKKFINLNPTCRRISQRHPYCCGGKKDVQALRELNIWGRHFYLKNGSKSFTDAVTEIERTGRWRLFCFLDFDRRGKLGTKRLKTCLEHAKVTPNLKFLAHHFWDSRRRAAMRRRFTLVYPSLAQKANCL